MILGDPHDVTAASANSIGQATLDDLFTRAALRRPGTVALIDPPNRRSFTDGAPRYVTYAAADRMVTAIAGRLQHLGLAPDTVIGLQLPNTVESVLALLGVLRAGMIAAPLPLLWRRAEMVTALSRIGAKAIITGGRIGAFDHGDLAREVAAEVFSIRHVCGFGATIADGVTPLSDLFTADKLDPLLPLGQRHSPAAHVAIVTWDATAQGLAPIARSHMEIIAGGMAILLEGRIERNATILASSMMGSFSGIALSVMPWLLSGGTLVLHQPFDPSVFASQCVEHCCDTVVLPGPVLPRFLEASLLAHEGLKNVLAVWRAPECLATSPLWRHARAGLVDVQVYGETGLIGTRREDSGKPTPIPCGPVLAPHGAGGGVVVVELARTDAGTLALRGPMVPRSPFPPGAERGDAPFLKADASGLLDTGYPCRVDTETGTLAVTGPPAGMVSVGGYRFGLRELQNLIERAAHGATIAALPDTFLSHRLAGSAADRAAVQQALSVRGVNPLVVGAFRDRNRPKAA